MKASIVLCTYNRGVLLQQALQSISQVVVSPQIQWEVLIVDNNSNDSTKVVTESFSELYPERFRYIFEGRQGKSFALNTGIREAKGEIIVFTDDDATVDPDWLTQVVQAMERYGCAGVGGKIVPTWNISKPRWLEMQGPHKLMDAIVSFDLGENVCPIKTAAFGANMAFRREMFQKYGGFRSDLGPTVGSEIRGEDSEFCRRLLKAGECLMYVPNAVVYHPVEKKRTEKSYFQTWYLDRGRASIREEGIPTSAVRYLNVPRYLYSILLKQVMQWLFCMSPKLRFRRKLEMYETWGRILESRASLKVGI